MVNQILASVNDDAASLQEMDGYLQRFGSSERAGEVRWLRASLLVRRGECERARPDLLSLEGDPLRGDDAAFALASCSSGPHRGEREQFKR